MAFGDFARQDDYGVDPMTGVPFAPSGEAQGKFGRIADAVIGGLRSWVEQPGKSYATAPEPSTGPMTEEEAFRLNMARNNAAQWGAGTAFGMLGVGTPAGMMGAVPKGAVGSSFSHPLYHGSSRADLTVLNESTRGPLGPGVYTSPAEGISRGYYAGPEGHVYTLPQKDRDIYQGAGHRTDAEWFGYKEDKKRLLAAAESEKRAALSEILDKMWSSDGYPTYGRIRQLYGGDEAAQGLFKKAGFEGISGLVDGPETLLFGKQPLGVELGAGSRDPAQTAAGTVMQASRDQGIRAYHGSPHDFDKFDLSKIGTGEGAQAYGHGLYFAENEGVARGYRDMLARGVDYKGQGLHIPEGPQGSAVVAISNKVVKGTDPALAHKAVIEEYLTAAQNARRTAEGQTGDVKFANLDRAKAYEGIARAAQDVNPADFSHSPGRMYEVSLNARPEQFLDHELNLNKQSPEVKEALWKSGIYQEGPYRSGALMYQDLADRGTVGQGHGVRQAAATEKLREAGIPGIRYLDQGSRTGGQGTSNFVVFDPGIIDILRKYGLAGAGATGFGTLAAQDNYEARP